MAEEVTPPGYPTSPPPGYPTAPPPPPSSGLARVGEIAGEELGKTPGRMLEGIKGLGQTLANPKLADVLPLSLGPGAPAASLGAKVAQGGARALTTGLGRGLDKPGDVGAKAWEGTKAATVAGLWEAALGAIPGARLHKFGIPSLKEKGQPVRDFEAAAQAPMQAFDAIKHRLPNNGTTPFMFIPKIDPRNPISPKDAAEALSKMRGQDYRIVREQIAHELNRFDKFKGNPNINPTSKKMGLAPKPWAGGEFKSKTAGALETPSRGEYRATELERMLGDPALHTAADIGATERVGAEPGVQAGAIPFLAIPGMGSKAYGGIRSLTRDLMGR